MDPIIAATGSALVAAVVTDAWTQVRGAVAAFWLRRRPGSDQVIYPALDGLRDRALTARRNGDQDTTQALVGAWRLSLEELTAGSTEALVELKTLLEHDLLPKLASRDKAAVASISQTARAD